MENLVNNVIKLEFDEIESYNFPLDEAFGLEVMNDGVKFCLIIKFSSTNKNLICCGPGAHARDSKTSKGILKKPPFIDRWSWFKFFEESFIAYADPIFFYDDKITLGWFVGDEQWYADTIASIIKKLAINQKISANNILFYGSSGGGFISIVLGTLIKESKVLVNNSQFTIMNYHKFHINNLLDVLKREFPLLSESEIVESLGYRLNTIELFKKEKYIPPIIYYVNVASRPDFLKHCLPFINEIQELDMYNDELTVHFYKEEKDKPHGPLPTNESVRLIRLFAKRYLYDRELIII